MVLQKAEINLLQSKDFTSKVGQYLLLFSSSTYVNIFFDLPHSDTKFYLEFKMALGHSKLINCSTGERINIFFQRYALEMTIKYQM